MSNFSPSMRYKKQIISFEKIYQVDDLTFVSIAKNTNHLHLRYKSSIPVILDKSI